jgi:cytochrome P450
MFNIFGIFVNSPELVQKVCLSENCIEKPLFTTKLIELDDGLLNARSSRWKHDRPFLNKAFNYFTIQSFLPIFEEIAEKFAREIVRFSGGDSFNIFKCTTKCTLQMICATSLGLKVLDNDDIFEEVVHAVN